MCAYVCAHAVSAPSNYDQLYKRYAAQGARVIALAYRDLGSEQV